MNGFQVQEHLVMHFETFCAENKHMLSSESKVLLLYSQKL